MATLHEVTPEEEERLDQALVPDPPFTAYAQFIGVTQHNLYHAGQIVLLKRALESARTRASRAPAWLEE